METYEEIEWAFLNKQEMDSWIEKKRVVKKSFQK